MSFEPRDYLRHILVEADYLITQAAGLERAQFMASRIPALRSQVASMLEA